jgi:hypothetical protein
MILTLMILTLKELKELKKKNFSLYVHTKSKPHKFPQLPIPVNHIPPPRRAA